MEKVWSAKSTSSFSTGYSSAKSQYITDVRAYGDKTGTPIFIYRLANVFGKWCRPNYNSAVATWCYNIARDLPIMVRDPEATVTLVYIDDVVRGFISCLYNREPCPYTKEGVPMSITPSYTKSLGEIVELIKSFHDEPDNLMVPDQADDFRKKLYSTYLAALPEDKFSYPLTMHSDNRGSFTEALHSAERGQVSVNVSKPGIVKGQHWHHTKHEKFLVVSGEGEINFRIADDPAAQIITYKVSGGKLEVVRVPPGYTHNIVNLGDRDMVTIMWANEIFDPEVPDTFRLNV